MLCVEKEKKKRKIFNIVQLFAAYSNKSVLLSRSLESTRKSTFNGTSASFPLSACPVCDNVSVISVKFCV